MPIHAARLMKNGAMPAPYDEASVSASDVTDTGSDIIFAAVSRSSSDWSGISVTASASELDSSADPSCSSPRPLGELGGSVGQLSDAVREALSARRGG